MRGALTWPLIALKEMILIENKHLILWPAASLTLPSEQIMNSQSNNEFVTRLRLATTSAIARGNSKTANAFRRS